MRPGDAGSGEPSAEHRRQLLRHPLKHKLHLHSGSSRHGGASGDVSTACPALQAQVWSMASAARVGEAAPAPSNLWRFEVGSGALSFVVLEGTQHQRQLQQPGRRRAGRRVQYSGSTSSDAGPTGRPAGRQEGAASAADSAGHPRRRSSPTTLHLNRGVERQVDPAGGYQHVGQSDALRQQQQHSSSAGATEGRRAEGGCRVHNLCEGENPRAVLDIERLADLRQRNGGVGGNDALRFPWVPPAAGCAGKGTGASHAHTLTRANT